MTNNLLWHVVNAQTGERLGTYRGREDRFPDSFYAKHFAEEGVQLKLMPMPPGKHAVANQVPKFFNSRRWREYIKESAIMLNSAGTGFSAEESFEDVLVFAVYVWYHRSNRSYFMFADVTGLQTKSGPMYSLYIRNGEVIAIMPISTSVYSRIKASTWDKYYDLIMTQVAPEIKEEINAICRTVDQATAQSSGAQDS